uniref:Uncharacterized protein n=1 Tax=uncultured bacterium contig00015 TaxID=1181506 RepID=A0A806KI81_9BACT|nr:hypothetical protein [uncultured bacterium contig00015]
MIASTQTLVWRRPDPNATDARDRDSPGRLAVRWGIVAVCFSLFISGGMAEVFPVDLKDPLNPAVKRGEIVSAARSRSIKRRR